MTRGRETSRSRAYASIRQQILSLALPPGSAVSENELAVSLGVSRTPVREALLMLAGQNLVQVFPKIGTFVTRVDPAQVAEAQFLREAVEVHSLRTVRFPLPPDVIEDLRANLAQQERPTPDMASFFELDEEFHRGLMRLAGHGESWATVAFAKGHLDRARMLGLTGLPAATTRAVHEHRVILDAVLDEDLERAVDALYAHVRTVFDDIVRLQAEAPHLFTRDDQQPIRWPSALG